jgi:hypothetical protein
MVKALCSRHMKTEAKTKRCDKETIPPPPFMCFCSMKIRFGVCAWGIKIRFKGELDYFLIWKLII